MWAKVSNDGTTILRTVEADLTGVALTVPTGGKPYWLPVEDEVVDTSVTPYTAEANDVVIEAARVVRRKTISDAAPAQLDVEDAAMFDAAFGDRGVNRLLLRMIFELYNEVRVLKGQGVITAAQFKAAVIDRMRG